MVGFSSCKGGSKSFNVCLSGETGILLSSHSALNHKKATLQLDLSYESGFGFSSQLSRKRSVAQELLRYTWRSRIVTQYNGLSQAPFPSMKFSALYDTARTKGDMKCFVVVRSMLRYSSLRTIRLLLPCFVSPSASLNKSEGCFGKALDKLASSIAKARNFVWSIIRFRAFNRSIPLLYEMLLKELLERSCVPSSLRC